MITARKYLSTPVPPRSRGRDGGFSLFEMMIVIALMGLVASMALLSFRPPVDYGGTIKDLYRELTFRRDEAIFSGRDYGLLVTHRGAQLLEYRTIGGWAEAEHPYHMAFASGDSIALAIDGRPVRIDDGTALITRPLTPQIMLLSSGELTSFALSVDGDVMRSGSQDIMLEAGS